MEKRKVRKTLERRRGNQAIKTPDEGSSGCLVLVEADILRAIGDEHVGKFCGGNPIETYQSKGGRFMVELHEVLTNRDGDARHGRLACAIEWVSQGRKPENILVIFRDKCPGTDEAVEKHARDFSLDFMAFYAKWYKGYIMLTYEELARSDEFFETIPMELYERYAECIGMGGPCEGCNGKKYCGESVKTGIRYGFHRNPEHEAVFGLTKPAEITRQSGAGKLHALEFIRRKLWRAIKA